MERKEMRALLSWKESEYRKPLIIKGARQVGKTWLMKEFGKRAYQHVAYVNFEKSGHLKKLFEDELRIDIILQGIEIETGEKVFPGETLIILDEIQAAPGALLALKYFAEDAPGYHVIAAGSLLGVALHSQASFPVGKVEFMDLYPLTYKEFLLAIGENQLADLLTAKEWKLIATFHSSYIRYLRQYYFTGGMPEVVSHFRDHADFDEARRIQNMILTSYEQDFSKHAPYEAVPRIRMLWESIPAQLAKENSKFIFGAVKKGSRAKDYEAALAWLTGCGLVYKITRISKPSIPLAAYADPNAFKLYITDVGLLSAMTGLGVKTLIDGNTIFQEFKGALTEQYVQQQLQGETDGIYYWSSERSLAEVDFVVQHADIAIPIEVKAEENLQAKSLRSFVEKFNSVRAIRTSMSNYREESWMINIPLYAVESGVERM